MNWGGRRPQVRIAVSRTVRPRPVDDRTAAELLGHSETSLNALSLAFHGVRGLFGCFGHQSAKLLRLLRVGLHLVLGKTRLES